MIQFTKGETVSGKLMDAGWKIVELANISAETSSTNKDGYVADFVVIAPAKYEGVEVRDFYYDKFGMGKMSRMIEAATGEEAQPDKQYNEQALVENKTRMKIHTEVRTNPKTGNPVNNITEYAHINRTDCIVNE